MSAVLRPEAPHLVPMTRTDLPAVMAIENDIYEFPWTRGNFEDSLHAGYSAWLFVADGEVIGYCVVMMAIDEAHLLNLSIARDRQGQGHGRAFLGATMAAVRERGARSMLLEVRPSNTVGRGLYAATGFAQIGLRKGYYPARRGKEDALVLRREL